MLAVKTILGVRAGTKQFFNLVSVKNDCHLVVLGSVYDGGNRIPITE